MGTGVSANIPQKGRAANPAIYHADIEQIRIVYDLVKVRGLKISAARELLRKNKRGTLETLEAVARLRKIKQELEGIRTALGDLQ